MRNQFDNQIHDALKEKLDSIHASEDLIALTLKNIKLDDAADSSDNKGQLSAIDTRFIRNHIRETERKSIKRQRRKITLISLGSVAAALMVFGGVFALTHIPKKSPTNISGISYVSYSASYYGTLRGYIENTDYNYAYVEQFTSLDPISYDSSNAGIKDIDASHKVINPNTQNTDFNTYNSPALNIEVEILDEEVTDCLLDEEYSAEDSDFECPLEDGSCANRPTDDKEYFL